MASKYLFKEKPLKEIRNHLIEYLGGSVNLIKKPDGLAIINLNQESKKNAITGKMMVDLYDIVEELECWSLGKSIILKGEKNNFCSGGDLDFVKKINTPEYGFMMSTFMQNVLNKFQNLPMLSIALIEGVGALGGGAELTVACDFRLITENCQGIGFVHGKMGIIPAWGGVNRLVEKIGYTNALDVLLTGKLYSPSECHKIGLVNEIIPEKENSLDYTIAWLKSRTKFDSEIIKSLKKCVRNAKEDPGNYKIEREIFAPFWGSPKNKEALLKNIKHKPDECKQ